MRTTAAILAAATLSGCALTPTEKWADGIAGGAILAGLVIAATMPGARQCDMIITADGQRTCVRYN